MQRLTTPQEIAAAERAFLRVFIPGSRSPGVHSLDAARSGSMGQDNAIWPWWVDAAQGPFTAFAPVRGMLVDTRESPILLGDRAGLYDLHGKFRSAIAAAAQQIGDTALYRVYSTNVRQGEALWYPFTIDRQDGWDWSPPREVRWDVGNVIYSGSGAWGIVDLQLGLWLAGGSAAFMEALNELMPQPFETYRHIAMERWKEQIPDRRVPAFATSVKPLEHLYGSEKAMALLAAHGIT